LTEDEKKYGDPEAFKRQWMTFRDVAATDWTPAKLKEAEKVSQERRQAASREKSEKANACMERAKAAKSVELMKLCVPD
jgi:hypothetical protein